MARRSEAIGGFDLKTWMVFSLCAVFLILTGIFPYSEAKEKKPSAEESVADPGSAKVMGVDEYTPNGHDLRFFFTHKYGSVVLSGTR